MSEQITHAGIRAGMLASTDWLAQHLNDPDLRIVDMRGRVTTSETPSGELKGVYAGQAEAYAAGHIPGAIYLDWTRDIVDPDDPIPAQAAPPARLATVLGERGIGDRSFVVAYDDHPASQFATRLWWLLRYNGHDRVLVLDGGLPKWQREGRPLSTETPRWPPATFPPRVRPALRVEAAEVLQALGRDDVRVLDARDEGQYTGAIRRAKRGGHIPGAISIPREALIDPTSGTFRDDAGLDGALQAARAGRQQRVIAYCNGGVAATSVLFALALRGHPLDQLANYDGSWNEWGNRDDVPIKHGAEP